MHLRSVSSSRRLVGSLARLAAFGLLVVLCTVPVVAADASAGDRPAGAEVAVAEEAAPVAVAEPLPRAPLPLFLRGDCQAAGTGTTTGVAGAEPIPGDPMPRANTCECTSNEDCNSVCFDSGTCLNGWCEPNSPYGGCDCREIGGGGDPQYPKDCDDCDGGCTINCTSNFDCSLSCPFGIGNCNSGKCLCAC